VKGKKPNSQESCRKKAESKSSPGEKKVQQARKKQLDNWQKSHPKSRRSAAQHLSAPGAKKKSRAKRSSSTARNRANRSSTSRKRAAR
jgi:hypothetical protein